MLNAMTEGATTLSAAAPLARPILSRDDWIMRWGILALGVWLSVAVVLPLYSLLSKGLEDHAGRFVGLANFAEFFATPVLFNSIYNSLTIAIISTAITITLAFIYAYALTRSCMPGKGIFKGIAMVPILAPSLLPAISLVYLFGNQGMIKEVLMGETIYGPIGIVMGEVFWTFPHALIIIITALSMADARLYEAAESLGTSKLSTI